MSHTQIHDVPLDQLLFNPAHPLVYGPTEPSDDSIITLSQRIITTGHVQPLVVSFGTPGVPDGTIVNGMRRAVAARLANCPHVPVIPRMFRSAEELKRAMVLDNEQREKDEWTKTLEFVTVFVSFQAEARERQREAARLTNARKRTRTRSATAPAENDATDMRAPDDVADSEHHPVSGTNSRSENSSLGADHDFAGGPPSPKHEERANVGPDEPNALPSPTALHGKSGGEAFKLAQRACGGGTTTLKRRLLLWEEARRLNPETPETSSVAAALRARDAKVEAVAKQFGLVPRTPTANVTKDPYSDPLMVARAFRGLFQHGEVPPGVDPRELGSAVQAAVKAGVTFARKVVDESLRLVHLCPRSGTNLVPLKEREMKVLARRLREEVQDARDSGWSRTRIASDAGICDEDAVAAFKAWCAGKGTVLRPGDLYRLAHWVEQNRGRPGPKNAASAKPKGAR